MEHEKPKTLRQELYLELTSKADTLPKKIHLDTILNWYYKRTYTDTRDVLRERMGNRAIYFIFFVMLFIIAKNQGFGFMMILALMAIYNLIQFLGNYSKFKKYYSFEEYIDFGDND